MEFKNYQIEEVALFRNDKISVEAIDDKDYISTENMIADKKGVTFNGSKPKSGSVNRFYSGDILISNIRPYFKKIWFSDREGAASPDVLIFRAKEKIILPKFLYYVLSNDVFFDYMVKTSKGTKMPRGDKNAILKYEVKIPSVHYQNKIVSILSLIDEKNSINANIINSLESISSTLFKSWFIDFEFPNEHGLPYRSSGGEMVESELGLIPKKWGFIELIELADKIYAGGTPSRKKEDYWQKGSIPWLKTKEIKNNYIINTEEFITKEGLKGSSAKWIPSHSIVVAMYGATAGQLGYLANEMTSNQACCAIVSDIPNFIFNYLLFNQKRLTDLATGSAQQNLSKDVISKFKMIGPTKDILNRYEEITIKFSEQIIELAVENSKLNALRDTLLPKLLSGEIEIPDESVVEYS